MYIGCGIIVSVVKGVGGVIEVRTMYEMLSSVLRKLETTTTTKAYLRSCTAVVGRTCSGRGLERPRLQSWMRT